MSIPRRIARLLALVLCTGCGHTHLPEPVPPNHERVTRVVLAADLPGDAAFCAQIPSGVDYQPPHLSCWGTVGDLRRLMVSQQRAN